MYNLIIILGPTASGKTRLAVELAFEIDSEIISADSRQLYKRMDLGTGKDLNEYNINGTLIKHHLIDIKEAGENYNVSEYQIDFANSFQNILQKNKLPILCGGTGMYIDAVLKGYQYTFVPVDPTLREMFKEMSDAELKLLFQNTISDFTSLADISTRKRLERSVEISKHLQHTNFKPVPFSVIKPIIFGLTTSLESRRERITNRLRFRLENGLVQEVANLLESGIAPEKLIFYGLEYKFITMHLAGKIDYDEMVEKLNVAIHQFAKRQMTYFRKMERDGLHIHWLDADEETHFNVKKIQMDLWRQ